MNTVCSPLLAFDFPTRRELPGALVFTDPSLVITAHKAEEVLPALDQVQKAVDDGAYAAGYIAYEASTAFDTAYSASAGCSIPLLWFGLFERPCTLPLDQEEADFSIGDWQPRTARDQYDRDFATIHEAIAAGATYQVNYTMRLSAAWSGDDYAYYRRLRASQNAAYSAYLNLGRYRILSASPELFFHRTDDAIVTRPMKGTARRGRTLAEDAAQAEWLQNSEKNRAENLMIVDLLRNDLGRIAKIGSVKAEDLFRIEKYRTLFQMTSKVSADLPPNTTLRDLLTALFPSGSITGAPKIKAMEIISDLEPSPRQIYCGAVGFLTPKRETIFNVAIRTLLLDAESGTAEYGTGGGITWDSNPSEEYAEALTKAAILTESWPDFDLLETLRLENGIYTLLDRHLQRLTASADYFDYAIDPNAIQTALNAHAFTHPQGARRARLLVSKSGKIAIESTPLPPNSPTPPRVAYARGSISTADRFLYHKTTNRAVYHRLRGDRTDILDVLLWNERHELTEFTIGNLVIEKNGERWTPPVESGLLPGVFRAHLLETGEVKERILTRNDLPGAGRVWLVNSVRGWVEVEMAG